MSLIDDIARNGFAGPYPLLSPAECASLLPKLTRKRRRKKEWSKGSAAVSPPFHAIASDPRVLDLVRPVLGENIVLWGAELIVRRPDTAHSFHCDIESSSPEGGFLTIWLGLENTSQASGLKFVKGSHGYGTTVQESKARFGTDTTSDESVLEAARRLDPNAVIDRPAVGDGEALVFDGRVWHGSNNPSPATRIALLLQYACADRPVFIPEAFDWPFRFKAEPRPPVLVVSGRAPIGVNRIARPPGARRLSLIPNAAFDLPEARPVAHFASMPHFRGRTAQIGFMDAHSSVLAPGASPHPLHKHVEEEILIVISGQADLLTAGDTDAKAVRRETMSAGDFAYYPAFQPHTLVNASDRPVLYTMLKWRNRRGRLRGKAKLSFVRAATLLFGKANLDKLNQGTMLNSRTRWLDRLHCHVSIATPGTGYAPHRDRYDVAIVLFAGTLETLGKQVPAPALLYHPARAPHGLKAVGPDPARYLVFELDNASSPFATLQRAWRKLLHKPA